MGILWVSGYCNGMAFLLLLVDIFSKIVCLLQMICFVNLRPAVCISASACKQHAFVLETHVIDDSKLIV